MTVLQLLLLIGFLVLYFATRRSWRAPASTYKINDSESYFDRDRKSDSMVPNKGLGNFSGSHQGEPDSDAWVNSSSRGMSLPAFPIGRPKQAAAEQAAGNVIRDDSVR